MYIIDDERDSDRRVSLSKGVGTTVMSMYHYHYSNSELDGDCVDEDVDTTGSAGDVGYGCLLYVDAGEIIGVCV